MKKKSKRKIERPVKIKERSPLTRAKEFFDDEFSTGGHPRAISQVEKKYCVEVLANVPVAEREMLIKASGLLRTHQKRLQRASVKAARR